MEPRPAQDIALIHKLVVEMGAERFIIERVRAELDARGWSQRQLSDKTKEVRNGKGTIHQGVLSALLKPGSGRHISIDQLITLAEVFNLPIAELLVPDDALANMRGWRYLLEAGELQNEIRHLTHRYNERLIDLRALMTASPQLVDRVREYQQELVERLAHEDDDTDWGPNVDVQAMNQLRINRYPVLVAAEDALKEGGDS